MRKLAIFTGTTLGGYAAWALADALGGSFFTCFLVSGAGSLLGVWAGWKAAMKLEE